MTEDLPETCATMAGDCPGPWCKRWRFVPSSTQSTRASTMSLLTIIPHSSARGLRHARIRLPVTDIRVFGWTTYTDPVERFYFQYPET